MQKASLGLFKSKQASDTSRQKENKRQSYRSYGSESPSLLNSPVSKASGLSPSLPGASSPTSIGDAAPPGFDRRDYVVDQIEEQEQRAETEQEIKDREQEPYRAPSSSNTNNKKTVVLGRKQSQRSSPPATSSTGRGASPLTIPEDNIDNILRSQITNNTSHYQNSTAKASTKSDQQKKKRRFWDNLGLGLSSSSASAPGNPGRSPSATGAHSAHGAAGPAGSPAAPHPKVLTKRRPGNTQRNQSYSKPAPSSQTEEDIEPAQNFAAKSRQRHSVIGLPIQTELELREESISSRDDLSQTKFYIGSTFTTASSQAQGEVGSQRTPAAWERLSRVQHQRTASTDESYAIQSAGTSAQKSRLEPNYSDQHYSNSRPPSRQSVDPPSPSEASYTLSHQRTTSSQNSTSTKGYMGSQNNQQQQQQPNSRNAEVQQNQSSREGMFAEQ